jgi:hypothetical protein
MEAVCRGIKPTIKRTHPTIEPGGKVGLPGYLENQSAGAEIIE